MAEKRNIGRLRKRLTLRFGIEEPARMAFTEDISSTGLFIKTANVCKPGAVVLVELALDNTTRVTMEAEVVWVKKVPPQMIHLVKKSGMGVRMNRFINGEAEYMRFCEDLVSRTL
jgi:Tfp pilus assembly protein PilZ